MEKDDQLFAAVDYREQIQERHHKDIYIDRQLLVDACEHIRNVFPGSFDGERLPLEILHEFFLERGVDIKLSLYEIEKMINMEIEDPEHPLRELFNDKQTRFDSFLSSEVTNKYIKEIENACTDLGLDMRGGVSVGMTHQKDMQAEQQHVFLTDCSVITVTENLFVLSHRFAKLLANSMAFEFANEDKYQLSSELDDYKNLLLSNKELQRKWDFFFADCAYDMSSPHMGEVVCLGDAHTQSFFADMKDAIMLFIIGHECGHHICRHSLNGQAGTESLTLEEKFIMEHEADIVGSKLTMSIGRNSDEFNFFASTNVGAFCILTVFDLINRGHQILSTGSEDIELQPNGTHPPTFDRLGVLRAYIKNYEYEIKSADLSLRLIELFCELLDFIWENSSKYIKKLHAQGIKPYESREEQWLP